MFNKFQAYVCQTLLHTLGLLLIILKDLLYEEDIKAFNLPLYSPCPAELEAIIESESSFSIARLETFKVNWNFCSTEDEIRKSENSSAKHIARTVRAATEPMLSSHFGSCFMDQIFERYAMHVTEHLCTRKIDNLFNIVVSLKRK